MAHELTHFDKQGRAKMVEVSEKGDTYREAVARGSIRLSANALDAIKQGQLKKGDPLEVAKIAGIMAAKSTDKLIPLCHPLLLTKIDVELTITDAGVDIQSTVGCVGKTGVEMEALTAVTVAALTIYDMCKAVDKTMTIGEIYLLKKTGGRSGTFVRSD